MNQEKKNFCGWKFGFCVFGRDLLVCFLMAVEFFWVYNCNSKWQWNDLDVIYF